MTIWTYGDSTTEELRHLFAPNICVFCKSNLSLLRDEEEFLDTGGTVYIRRMTTRRKVEVCQSCGWWRVEDHITETCSQPGIRLVGPYTCGAVGSLKQLALHDISTPIDEVRSYLLGKRESRFELHPRLFEQTVASVFGDLGFAVNVTAYSGDGGIDVILEKSGEQIGVQEKRYKGKVGVEQIRELVDALVLRDARTGIFVTTSGFTRGSQKTADQYAVHGYALELIDGESFLHALSIAQRPMYSSYGEFLEAIGELKLQGLDGNFQELI